LEEELEFEGLESGEHTLLIRIANPLETGQPVRFANRSQDADVDGWLTLGMVKYP
jgi:hypothetical protein